MIELVISGGQTGADQAGWRAAKAAGIDTGGWMPKGFKTEDGRRPDFEEMCGAREHNPSAHPPRTMANVRDSHATIFFGRESPGYIATKRACDGFGRDFYWHNMETNDDHDDMVEWLVESKCSILNVAGNRESSNPGIGKWVEKYLAEVFRLLSQ